MSEEKRCGDCDHWQDDNSCKVNFGVVYNDDETCSCFYNDNSGNEECGCCFGTGICAEIDGKEFSCMTCNGKGYHQW